MSLIGQSVTVLGAGIAGLAVARALALRGAGVVVLEQAAGFEDVGAGIQISPNGAAVLRALGLGPALEACSTRAEAVELRNGATGAVVTRLEVARLRPQHGYHFLHRADLVGLLAEGAREAGVEVRFGQRVDRVDLAGPWPACDLGGIRHEAGLLIGADGLHSQVRDALNGATAPFFTRQVAWRALIPGDGGPAVAEVHMGAGRHLVSYPLRGGALRNIVAVEERGDWAAEGWSHRDDPAALRAAFAGFGPRVRGWLDAVQQVHLWGLFRHPVAARWQAGAAAILGDAAHPMLPFLAQGASMALEDAWVLADCLAMADRPAAGLAAYQAARAPRCRRVVDAASLNARLYHLSGLQRVVAHAGLKAVGRVAPSLPLRRFDWLYGLDVTR
ncbi:MAG: FAD-dependent monooxygenase [Pseudomonadota bacterium]